MTMKHDSDHGFLSNFRQTMRVFFGRGLIVKVSAAIILAFLLIAIFGPIISPYTATEQNVRNMLAGASAKHWLGTDQFGRDVLTRLMYGARISFISSCTASIVSAVIGILLGLVAGYYKGPFSQVIMRMTDVVLSIPTLILIMVLAMFFKNGSIFAVGFSIGIASVPSYTRIVNSVVLSLKENDYIVASGVIGQGTMKILFRHILPNCFPSIIVLFTLNLGSAIMMESSLSYLGIGLTPPTPSWGCMVADGYKYLTSKPMLALVPGICIILMVVSFNVLGDSLRDALDPRLRGKL